MKKHRLDFLEELSRIGVRRLRNLHSKKSDILIKNWKEMLREIAYAKFSFKS
jgi:hypothetical protein